MPAGLVTVELTNTGEVFHEAQLIRLNPGHTPDEALRVIAAEGAPSPAWITPPAVPVPHRHRQEPRDTAG